MTRPGRLFLIGGIVGSVAALPATAQTVETRVETSAGAGYNSNPYLLTGGSTGAASIDVEVRPSIDVTESRGRLSAQAYYRRKEFLTRYSGTDSFGGDLSANYRLSSTATLTGLATYTNAIIDAASLFTTGFLGAAPVPGDPAAVGPVNPIGGLQPGAGPIDPISGDVGLIGLRQRRSQLNGTLDVAIRPNQTDNWVFGVLGSKARYPGTIASDYSTYGGIFGYSRALSTLSTLGVTGTVLVVNSSGASRSSRVYSPQLTYTRRLPRNWTIEASGGVSIVDGDRGVGSGSSVSSAFQLNACSEGVRSKFCLIALRSANPSGTNRINVQTVARASYLHKFSEKSFLNADASYNSVSRPALDRRNTAQNFFSAALGYRREVSRRLQMVGQVSYQGRDAANASNPSDIAGRLGVVAILGKPYD